MAAAAASGPAQWVQARVSNNGLAIITLDRPEALNAMNLEMDVIYRKHLSEWASDAAVKSVLVEGSSPLTFCAGMDVKGVAAAVKEDKTSSLPYQVFGAEYSLICEIARYNKPYISVMNGITMGFGIGLSGHGRYRVVTEKTTLAMPENAIGLFPDVGFAHLMAESPGNGALGSYLALTGARVKNPADALYVGLATHYVPSANLPALREALLQGDLSNDAHQKVEEVLSTYSQIPEGESKLKALLPSITACFGSSKSVIDSVEALKKEEQSSDPGVAEWAKGALEGLRNGAPFSLCVTQMHYAQVAAAASVPSDPLAKVEGVMRTEYILGVKTSTRNDFLEGVRALLIDKDKKPQWQPVALEDVNSEEIKEVFSPLEGHPPPF
ncbi:unnamed protein product [Calypogeia fissa]